MLFASFRDCLSPGADSDYGVILFSSDEGGSWRQVSEAILHAEFGYVDFVGEGSIRIFGELYSEGPALDPFVLATGTGDWSWDHHQIYTGAAHLEGVASVDENHILAWVRHLELGDDGWDGEVFVHRSDDGGRSWKQLGFASSYPEAHEEHRLASIQRAAMGWRIVDDESGGFEIQRPLAGESGWHTAATFPWRACDSSEQEAGRR